MAEECDLTAAEGCVGIGEIAADDGRDSQCAQEARCDDLRFQLLRFAVAGDGELASGGGGDAIEDGGLVAPPCVLEVRDAPAKDGVGRGVGGGDEAGGVAIRERAEEDGIDDAEDGRVGADAQGGGQDDDGGECRVVLEAAAGVPQVGREAVEPRELPHFAYLLLDARDVSECALGRMTGLIGRQAGLLELFGFEFQIGAQFAFQVVLAMFATEPPHFSPPRRGNDPRRSVGRYSTLIGQLQGRRPTVVSVSLPGGDRRVVSGIWDSYNTGNETGHFIAARRDGVRADVLLA